MATATKQRPLKKGNRVIATVDLRGVPEGTAGKVKVIAGLGSWMRAWVEFDNGVWLGSISIDRLVREDDWEDFKVRRVEEAEQAARRQEEAAVAKEAAPAAAAEAGPAASEAASKVPAHLLERSRQARERKAAAAAGE